MKNKNISQITEEILEGFLNENNLELYACHFKKEGADWNLSVFIEKIPESQGISTDDCELVSRYLSQKLDELDPVSQAYNLVVSSPGMDRELTKEDHYKRYVGREVDLKLYQAFGGKKKYSGIMKAVDEENLLLTDEEGDHLIPRGLISKTKLALVF